MLRILVVTRSYPADGDLYKYPFVHRRVLAYFAAGHEVAVFQPTAAPRMTSHIFEGVTCVSGDGGVLRQFAKDWKPDVVAAHGFTEQMHVALSCIDPPIPTCAWLHGSEIPGFQRVKALAMTDPTEREQGLDAVATRCAFWDEFLSNVPHAFKFVFVSQSAVELARQDWGPRLADEHFAIIHNPIDTDLFAYRPKVAADRFKVLMIRPFDSPTYGNDLAVAAIVDLARRPGFEKLGFAIIGDGPLFEETVEPIRSLANVRLQRRFMTQGEIADEHAVHGIFLVPTRLDTQGVSRDEAMASGLVPVTNAVSAVPEFVDSNCAGLAGPDDAPGLADRIWEMVERPELFLQRSKNAASRVRAQSGADLTIPMELGLLTQAVCSSIKPVHD